MPPRPFPPNRGWLQPGHVEYMKNLLQLLVLLLAVPWLLRQLWRDPAALVRGAGVRQVGA